MIHAKILGKEGFYWGNTFNTLEEAEAFIQELINSGKAAEGATATYEEYDPSADIAKEEYNKRIAKRIARINFGNLLFATLAERNVERLKAGQTTLADILVVEEALASIQRKLSNSSLEMAKAELAALDLPQLPNTEKQFFVDMINDFLSKEIQ